MPDEQTTIDETPVPGAQSARQRPPAADQSAASERWIEDSEELPRRPRRRLLTPLPLALLAVLILACGFIGGVLVEKGQGGGSSSAGATGAGLASRFAALRGGGARNGAGASATGESARSASGSSGAAAPGGAGATVGQVAYLAGGTLYVTTGEGNTVKVTTSPASSVTKSVKTSVKSIHPGETVLISGTPGANGAIAASSIRVGDAGTSPLGGLFGGGRSTARGGSASAGGGEPALFGNGG